MIHLVVKSEWSNIKITNTKNIEACELLDKDIVFIGSGNNSTTNCVEYAEKQSVESNENIMYHIYSIITSRCNYMTFNSGMSNHTHLEKMVIYKGNLLVRNNNYEMDDSAVLIFDNNLNPKGNNVFDKRNQYFIIVH